MKMFWRLFAAVAAIALFTAVRPACVFACSCIAPPPPAEALANSTAVFSGKVTDIVNPADMGGADPVQVTFAVSKGWKGADQQTMTISTSASSAACGFTFEKDQEYLVYASENEGRLSTSLCSRTAQLALAGNDIAELGEGTVPTAGGAPETPVTLPDTGSSMSPYLVPALLGGGLLLLVVLGSVMVTRRRSDA